MRVSCSSMLTAIVLLSLVACASSPSLAPDFARVEAAISQAKQVKANEYTSNDLRQAQQKLDAARQAQDSGDSRRAKRLLEQARLHAELAEVKAMSDKSALALKQINENLRALAAEVEQQ